mgnify:CR=1 FL=1
MASLSSANIARAASSLLLRAYPTPPKVSSFLREIRRPAETNKFLRQQSGQNVSDRIDATHARRTRAAHAMSWFGWLPDVSSLMGGTTSQPANAPPPAVQLTEEQMRERGIASMDAEFRQKYAKGAKFNFKVVLRGDIGTGKSTLMRRLRGGTFIPEYTPTPEIKTSHIKWTARSSPEDNVMLEVWDVVDKAAKRAVSDALKTMAHDGARASESHVMMGAKEGGHTYPLDASVIDVYKGAHAAVFLVDPSKRWTYEYAKRELAAAPEHVPTAILLNFRDYPASKRLLRADEVEADCGYAFKGRPFRPFVMETSLLNCYGLQALSTFLHIPFLCLKRAALEQAVALNTKAIVQAQEALKHVKGNAYEAYERKIEATQGRASASAAADALEEKNKETKKKKETGPPPEPTVTWEKLSKTTLGEAPILLGGAALGAVYTGVSTLAATTPAEIIEAAKESVSIEKLGSGLASLVTREKKGNFDAAERERTAPQFNHLTGRGGAAAAAFGGQDLDEDDVGVRPGDMPGGEKSMDKFFDEEDTPRAGDGSDAGDDGDGWGGGSDDDLPGGGGGDARPFWDDDDDDDDDDGGGREKKKKVEVRWDESSDGSGGSSDSDSDIEFDVADDDDDRDDGGGDAGAGGEKEDPFFGVGAIEKQNPTAKTATPRRAAPGSAPPPGPGFDLNDPAAIAAAFGSPAADDDGDEPPVGGGTPATTNPLYDTTPTGSPTAAKARSPAPPPAPSSAGAKETVAVAVAAADADADEGSGDGESDGEAKRRAAKNAKKKAAKKASKKKKKDEGDGGGDGGGGGGGSGSDSKSKKSASRRAKDWDEDD